ncbi:hypothetical protein CI102_588 [Trichoderma harzianum]|uniref:Prion-inhibition and propagation HeLo domain-containing protein n=1 Tax=Trichoderma harzianum CBS 226.95 TaxID=983964 RepID=A0A2T4A2F3_TRIHA|nr:hypothetical protein M431DRAFT_122618 [Trichoderma harzianum CBS 226.95]PKK54240.1 hypothetical protein CI102_588 [Trichoderma harzianum]PTB51153.1 hypothetical protein M431DRAFT_122618 [Trichoderma harzianum CBS 226.95]
MDAVRGTASIFHLLQQCLSHIKQVRRFETEFRIYELHLQMHLSRCATIARIIHDTNRVDDFLSMNATGDTISVSRDREPTAAEILSAIQDALRIAQREAAQIRADCSTQARMTGFVDKRKAQATKTIGVVKWAFYKRDDCNKFIEEISSIILHLEHQVDRERRTLESW